MYWLVGLDIDDPRIQDHSLKFLFHFLEFLDNSVGKRQVIIFIMDFKGSSSLLPSFSALWCVISDCEILNRISSISGLLVWQPRPQAPWAPWPTPLPLAAIARIAVPRATKLKEICNQCYKKFACCKGKEHLIFDCQKRPQNSNNHAYHEDTIGSLMVPLL